MNGAAVDAPRQTARWVGLVYGKQPSLDDPAETYHEASKVSPSQIGRQVEGARRLESSVDLQISSTRAVKRLGRPRVELPQGSRPRCALWEAIAGRRSQRVFTAGQIAIDELTALLQAGYGVTELLEGSDRSRALPLRAVPSGGALYPLELYVAVLRVAGIDAGLYHFDPLRRDLEIVRAGLAPDEVAALSTYPEIVAPCSALLLIAAVFWRVRFKYGQRAYRFALLEAGHVGQNVALSAVALGIGAVPLGGYYDRLTDEFLGLDGVNESVLYTIALGTVSAGR